MKQMSNWTPFRSLTGIDVPAGFDEFFRGFGMRPAWRELEVMPEIRIDVSEDDKSYKVKADIPGVKKEDIEISIEGRQVEISAETHNKVEKKTESCLYTERHDGRMYRSFILPAEVDSKHVEAKYDGGVLSMTLAKMPNGKGQRITVS